MAHGHSRNYTTLTDATTCDARHLLLAFAIQRIPIANSVMSEYRPTGFKIVDLHGLLCDVKYEFNSDNRRLYADGMILAEGRV
jgi:hypothetical protein